MAGELELIAEELDAEELERFGRILDLRPVSLRGQSVGMALAAQLLYVRTREGWTAPLATKSTCQEKAPAGSVPSVASVAEPLNEIVWPPLYLAPTIGVSIEAAGGELPATTCVVAVPVEAPSLSVNVAV